MTNANAEKNKKKEKTPKNESYTLRLTITKERNKHWEIKVFFTKTDIGLWEERNHVL